MSIFLCRVHSAPSFFFVPSTCRRSAPIRLCAVDPRSGSAWRAIEVVRDTNCRSCLRFGEDDETKKQNPNRNIWHPPIMTELCFRPGGSAGLTGLCAGQLRLDDLVSSFVLPFRRERRSITGRLGLKRRHVYRPQGHPTCKRRFKVPKNCLSCIGCQRPRFAVQPTPVSC